MRRVLNWSLIVAVVLMTLAVVGVLFYLDWTAYFQRFPEADGWTYFFQGK